MFFLNNFCFEYFCFFVIMRCILLVTFASSIFCFLKKERLSFLSVLMLTLVITVSCFCWICTHLAIRFLRRFWNTLMKTIPWVGNLEQGNTSQEKKIVVVIFILNRTFVAAKNCGHKVLVNCNCTKLSESSSGHSVFNKKGVGCWEKGEWTFSSGVAVFT